MEETLDLIRRHHFNWRKIARLPDLPEELIEEFADRLEWELLCEYQNLSDPVIRRHFHRMDWNIYCLYQPLSDSVISEFSALLPWHIVVKRQVLSMEVIREFWDYLAPYLHDLVRYQTIEADWMKERGLIYPETRMDQWGLERKLARLSAFQYEWDESLDVIYAYKATLADGYSILNRKIRYEVGRESRDWHCDSNIDIPYSFGLSSGFRFQAIHFYPRGNLYQVKIPFSDLGCVTEQGVLRSKGLTPIYQIK